MNRWLASFLRLFFRLLYTEFAWTYDMVAWLVSLGRWKSWVAASLPFLPGQRVLELGHGPGHLQVALAKRGIQSYGLDTSRQMVHLAYQRMVRHDLVPRLLRSTTPDFPFPSNSFDQIVATFPTEYILQAATLAEVYRLLRPGGSLVLVPVAWITGRGWLDRLAAGVFRLTGQAPEWDARWLARLETAGFYASACPQDLGDSQVMVLLGNKP